MTDEERKQIVSDVLAALKQNSTTIDQMLEKENCADDDFFETNKGNKISFKTLSKGFNEEQGAVGDAVRYQLKRSDGKKLYPQTSSACVTMSDGDDSLDTRVKNITTEYNVSLFHPKQGIDGGNKYTLSSAIALVPEKYRSIGIKCSFLNESGECETWEYKVLGWDARNFINVGSSIISNLSAKSELLFSIKYRDGRRLFYNPTDKSVCIRGAESAKDDILLAFTYGVRYTITDSVPKKVLSDIGSGNCGLFLPVSSVDVEYTLNDIICFNDDELHDGFLKIAHITYAKEVSGNIILNYNSLNFDVIDNTSVDDIKETGIYKIKSANSPYILYVYKESESKITQMRQFVYSDSGINLQVRSYNGESWSSWDDSIKNASINPILKNHAVEIQYFDSARLYWNADSQKLTIEGNVPSNGYVCRFVWFGINVIINNSVKERVITENGNYQLLVPVPSESNTAYSLNDIQIVEGTVYDASAYIKIGHLVFGKGMSSFIIKDREVLISDFNQEKINIHSLLSGYNYNSDVLQNYNIESTGIIKTYQNRGALFFRLPKKGIPGIISGCTVLAYQWYSSVPDYEDGTNSISRTTKNTPPDNAEYCGITIDITKDYSTITITGNANSGQNKYDSLLNNSFGEYCFANGLKQELKILGFGNSFMRNSVFYLSDIAKGLGINLTVGNLYQGGVNLSTHLNNLKNELNPYEYHKYVNGENTENSNNKTGQYGLQEDRWDVVILHQYQPAPLMPNYEPFEPYLSNLIKEIVSILGYCPKFYLNATWAGSLDSNETYYGYNTEEEMLQAVMDENYKALEDIGIINLIPTGIAIQNARKLPIADTYNRFVNKEGNDYHHLNAAGGFIAACTIYEKIIYPLSKKHCDTTTFRVNSAVALPPQTLVEEGILVTDDNYKSFCQAAIDAIGF